MCGRLNIINTSLCKIVSDTIGLNFHSETNDNLCPSESLSTIVQINEHFSQVNMQWGIQPSWSKRLLINAQSETVAIKPTFAKAFAAHRCLVPLTTKPNLLCEQYHHRMPVFILPDNINAWLAPQNSHANLSRLMSAIPDEYISVTTS